MRNTRKRRTKTREPSHREKKSATIFDALSIEDRVYILDREIKEKEAKLTDLKNEDYKLSKFLNKVKLPLLMDPNSTKYNKESLKVVQENEYLRRKVEELEMELDESEKALKNRYGKVKTGETFDSLAKKKKDWKTKTKAVMLVQRKYDVSSKIFQNLRVL